MPWPLLQSDPGAWVDIVDKGGVIGLLVLIIFVILVGGAREWYGPASLLKELRRTIAEQAAEIADLKRQNTAKDAELTAMREEHWRLLGTMEQALTPPRRRPGSGT